MKRSKPTLDDLIYEAGVPLGDLADAAGLSLRGLLSLRQGDIETPRVATVAKLAKALRVDVARVRAACEASRAAAAKG